MRRLLWRLQTWLDGMIYNERSARWVRVWFVILLTFSLTLSGYILFEKPMPNGWAEELSGHPLFSRFPSLAARTLYIFMFSARHVIIPIAAFVGAVLASAFYIQDIYELPSWKQGWRYILAAFLGLNYPHLIISEGKKQIPEGEINLIDVIGGPGYVRIRPGNVVLFESLRSPSSVRANESNFISRFETIKEIVSLEDQHGFIAEIPAKTKDGIEVIVRDVHYRYRLRTGRRFGDYEQRSAENPYPFSVQAVRDMAYNRSVRADGLTSWHNSVRSTFDSAITDYIRAHTFDQLTAPNFTDEDPRQEIAKAMQKGVRLRLRNIGAELLWSGIGHFDISERMKDVIEKQRVEAWGARWAGNAAVKRADGEAQRMARRDTARAEAQAELLEAFIQALEDATVGAKGDPDRQRAQNLRNLRAIIWTKVAQVLDATAEDVQQPPNE